MPQTINLYAYAEGDPLRLIDPEGEFGFIGRAIAGAVIGAAIQITVDMATSCFGDGGCEVDWAGVGGAALEGAIVGALGPSASGARWGRVAWSIGTGAVGGAAGAGFASILGSEDANVLEGLAFGAAGGLVGGLADEAATALLKGGDELVSGFKRRPDYGYERLMTRVREASNTRSWYQSGSKFQIWDDLTTKQWLEPTGMMLDVGVSQLKTLTVAATD
jgi:hypothetical protein